MFANDLVLGNDMDKVGEPIKGIVLRRVVEVEHVGLVEHDLADDCAFRFQFGRIIRILSACGPCPQSAEGDESERKTTNCRRRTSH